MLTVRSLLIVLLTAFVAFGARASQEGTAVLSEFQLTAADVPPLGQATVSGSYAYPNFTRIEAQAFGRRFSLTPAQLAKLKGFTPNGAYLSQISPGRSGGGMLYLVLVQSFLSGAPERRYVAFTSDGKIGVGVSP